MGSVLVSTNAFLAQVTDVIRVDSMQLDMSSLSIRCRYGSLLATCPVLILLYSSQKDREELYCLTAV